MDLPTSVFTPRRHLLLKTGAAELSRWLDREFPARLGLFVYFHRQTGNYVVGKWLKKGEFIDVINIGPSLSFFGRAEALELKRKCYRPTSNRFLRKMLADADYLKRRRTADESWENHERYRVPRKIQILRP